MKRGVLKPIHMQCAATGWGVGGVCDAGVPRVALSADSVMTLVFDTIDFPFGNTAASTLNVISCDRAQRSLHLLPGYAPRAPIGPALGLMRISLSARAEENAVEYLRRKPQF